MYRTDRFKEMEDYIPQAVASCCNCNTLLYEDEEFLDMEGEYLCDEVCLMRYMNVRRVEGWEIK